MAELVKCKSCGFVMEAGKAHDVCPACGVPSKMFEPYIDPVSDKRRFILGLDIHSIIVHFPQAFGATVFIFSAALFFIQGRLKDYITAALTVIAFLLPAVLVVSFLTGLFDGTVRFRKLSSPFIVQKIIWASVYTLLSVIYLAVLLKTGFGAVSLTLISAGMLGSSTILGLIGTKLVSAKFPG